MLIILVTSLQSLLPYICDFMNFRSCEAIVRVLISLSNCAYYAAVLMVLYVSLEMANYGPEIVVGTR